MPTYLEQHLPNSPTSLGMTWIEFFNLPIEAYNLELLTNAKRAAGSWVTCACGNQDARLPRHPNGTPLDFKLLNLGLDFATFIDNLPRHLFLQETFKENREDFRSRGLEVLKEIDKRAHLILNRLDENTEPTPGIQST